MKDMALMFAKQKMLASKKGTSLNQVPAIVLTIGISIFIGAIMVYMVVELSGQSTDGNFTAVTNYGKEALVAIFALFTLIATIVGLVIGLKYVMKAFQ